jgi:hypothetical protein
MQPPKPNIVEPTDEEIALGAYRLWLQAGCPHGRDQEHWLKARAQLIKAKENSAEEESAPGA